MDTSYFVETPEGIDLQADLAGPAPRVLAYAIDWLIKTVLLIAIYFVTEMFGGFGTGVYLISMFLFAWFYPVFFEVLKRGQTPGKKQLKIAVVNQDLTPVRWEASIIRNLLRFADFLPFFYLFGLVSMCVTGQFQRLGDIAAGTLVIYRPEKDETLELPDARPIAPPLGIGEEEQLALIAFARRHKELSVPRQKELANLLSPITRSQGDQAVEQVRGMGNWLAGKR